MVCEEKGVNITDCFTPARGRDPDEEPAAGASKADNSPHYKERQRAAGKGGKKMVQRPKLNSTCKITTAGWDLGGARRDMTGLKARNKGKKPNEIRSPCSQHRLKEGKTGKNTEKQLLRDKCWRGGR